MKRNNEWLKTYPPKMVKSIVIEIFNNPQATCKDEIPNSMGRFGIDETNPISIFGVPNNKNYLDRLRSENGDHIQWERIGCLNVEEIQMPVDKYEIYDIKGKMLNTLFLSSYHLRTSKKAPKGFIMVDNEGS